MLSWYAECGLCALLSRRLLLPLKSEVAFSDFIVYESSSRSMLRQEITGYKYLKCNYFDCWWLWIVDFFYVLRNNYFVLQVISYDSKRGGVSVITEKGEVTVSCLLIQQATHADTGFYSCSPSNTDVAMVKVHILEGKYYVIVVWNFY